MAAPVCEYCGVESSFRLPIGLERDPLFRLLASTLLCTRYQSTITPDNGMLVQS